MSNFQRYEHRVQYYETDQMGIVHHSNYIRWFEEARIDWMRQAGVSYRELERQGVISPVLSVSAEYRTMVHFDDVVEIDVRIRKFNGIILELEYEVKDKETGELRTKGESRHCFLGRDQKLVSLKKDYPGIYEAFQKFSKKS